jgi:putative ABC transport system permease protein
VLPESTKARRWMRPYALVYTYRRRLRVQRTQELFAGVGIAVAVALVFAVTVANRSIAGSATRVVHTVIGPATLQLQARSSNGFSERLFFRAENLPGVKRAAELLEQPATIRGLHGRHIAAILAGTDISLAVLDGLAHTLPISSLAPGGIALSTTSAHELGIGPLGTQPTKAVSLDIRGSASSLKVAAVLGPEAVGALSEAFLATMPLGHLQRLAGLKGRITRILVETEPGREARVRNELEKLAAGRLTVSAADQDVGLLRQALRSSDQASAFFAAIAGLLGVLFAFNAILLTVPERREIIADLRIVGTRRTAIVQMVIFQALCLGIAASLVGLLVGYALSVGFFHEAPGYLSQAFTLGGGTVIGVAPVLLSVAGGILSTCVASMVPLLDLRRGRAVDAVSFETGAPGNTLGKRTPKILAVVAGVLLAVATAVFVLIPTLTLFACVILALATALLIPLVFAGVLGAAGAVAERRQRLTILPVALMSLRATTLRALALAATGALALFGSVALGGARDDLLRGIEGYIGQYVSGADMWIVNPNDPTAVEPLSNINTSYIGQIRGVSGVRTFQDGYLNIGERRVWIIARPAGTSRGILQGQIVDGNADLAAHRIDGGGWIAVSQQIAEEHHVKVGDIMTIPTPHGDLDFKIAATTTNLTWSPGAILMSDVDYSQDWETSAPTALGIDLSANTHTTNELTTIRNALGRTDGLEVLTASRRASRTSAVAREGLGKLQEISTLLLIAAIIAITAALTSAIWQRRVSLANLRLSGIEPYRLRRILLTEATLMLAAACFTGAVAGIYGQLIIDSYLRHVTGFPVAHIATGWRPVEILVLVVCAVLMLVVVPGWRASHVSPTLALEDEDQPRR